MYRCGMEIHGNKLSCSHCSSTTFNNVLTTSNSHYFQQRSHYFQQPFLLTTLSLLCSQNFQKRHVPHPDSVSEGSAALSLGDAEAHGDNGRPRQIPSHPVQGCHRIRHFAIPLQLPRSGSEARGWQCVYSSCTFEDRDGRDRIFARCFDDGDF